MRFGNHVSEPSPESLVVSQAEQQPAAHGPVTWANEPSTLDDLTARYEIEHKVPARTPGATLFITRATEHDGQQHDICEGQTLKLFIVP